MFVNLNANSTFGNVPDTTSTTVVELVWHTLVHSTVNPDINIIADVIGSEVSGKGDCTLLPEWTRERVSRARSQTMTSRHLLLLLGFLRRSRTWYEMEVISCFLCMNLGFLIGLLYLLLLIGLFILKTKKTLLPTSFAPTQPNWPKYLKGANNLLSYSFNAYILCVS